jgi:hypothetical protein
MMLNYLDRIWTAFLMLDLYVTNRPAYDALVARCSIYGDGSLKNLFYYAFKPPSFVYKMWQKEREARQEAATLPDNVLYLPWVARAN